MSRKRILLQSDKTNKKRYSSKMWLPKKKKEEKGVKSYDMSDKEKETERERERDIQSYYMVSS